MLILNALVWKWYRPARIQLVKISHLDPPARSKEAGKCSSFFCPGRGNKFGTHLVSIYDRIGSKIVPVKINIILFITFHKMN